MNTTDFQFFVRVAALGSISQAAKEAHLSVSVASQKIQRLEQDLQLRLFHRTTRKLHLTTEGECLLKQGQPLLAEFWQLHEGLSQGKQELTGRLNITAPSSFGNHVLIHALADFQKQHPQLQLCIDLNDQNVDLVATGMDAAIRIGILKDSSLIAKPLSANPRLLCAAPEYLQQYGEPLSPADLIQHRCLLQQHSHGITNKWSLFNAKNAIESVSVQGYFVSNSGEAIRQACLHGMGIGNFSLWHVADDLAQGRLQAVLTDHTIESSTIYLLYPARQLLPLKVQLLSEFLQEHFQHHYKFGLNG